MRFFSIESVFLKDKKLFHIEQDKSKLKNQKKTNEYYLCIECAIYICVNMGYSTASF